ncbi:MAG: ASKHA domain-containing protein [Syntrophobacteraceae bacterium]
MPTITIKTGDGDRHIEFSTGRYLREILDCTAFRVRSGCRGTGACGLCRVQIKAGELAEANPVERIYLSESQIASGVRLACQVMPQSDLEVSILSREPVSSWRAIPAPSTALPGFSSFTSTSFISTSFISKLPKCPGKPYGVAVDLGTTHISLSFYDLSTGEWFAGRRGLNPQGTYGADVMARLVAANESQQAARELRRLAVDAIGSAIMDVAIREGFFDDKRGAEQVVKVAIAGNTAMLALLSGRNSHLLLQPAYWTRYIDCSAENTENSQELCLEWGINPGALVEVMPPLAGFVGSDLLAGAFAAGLIEGERGSLLIDFGTNSEIALWDSRSLWVTSAAGGPAFEGCGIGCGTPAEPGAIYRVTRPRSDCLAALEFQTIDDEKPLGLCGSGLVDLIACLLESGKLTSIGRFSAEVPRGGIVLLNGDRRPLVLTKRDVDIFQRAKAAIFAGVRILLSKASMSPKELRRVYVGGAFGHFLNRESAVSVGLLPDLSEGAVELCGNTALRGCEQLLMSSGSAEIIAALRDRAKLVNMAQCGEFEDFFLQGLYLARWADCDEIRG